MASPSFAAAATSPASSPLTLDPIPLASRPPVGAATTAAPRKRPVFLLDQRPHPASPNPVASSAAAAPQARRKKSHSSSSSSSRPRWQTVLSVAAKNAALLAVLLYLGDAAWRWSHPPPPADRAALEGYEARVAEVEASLVRSFKMMQLQLEAVDRKIDGEVGAARGDLLALLEEKRRALEAQLARLGARADDLGDALAGLRRTEFLRKDELEKFWDEVRGGLASESGTEVDLDQVRALARDIAMKEIEKHAADGIGRVDYALGSAGGRVVRTSTPYDAKRGGFFPSLGLGDKTDSQLQKMLQPSFGEPGQCSALQGSTGFVEIKLKTAIIPEAVTLEHVSKDVAYDRSTAPKDCRVSGWYDETPGETRSSDAAKMSALVAFTYDLEKSNVQTFDITAPDVGVINMVRLDFTSNHGNSLLTCIYRLRVHGHEPISPRNIGSQA